MIGTISLTIDNFVQEKDDPVLAGIIELENGWNLDRTVLHKLEDSYPDSNTFIEFSSTEGLSKEDFQCGIISGIDEIQIEEKTIDGIKLYVPTVETGMYSIHSEDRKLYSDYSVSYNFESDELLDLCNSCVLDDTCLWSSIDVCFYERDSEANIIVANRFNYVEEFTGEIDVDSRLPTKDETGYLIDNMSTRFYEFTIDEGTVILNGNHERTIGIGTEDSEIEDGWISIEASAGLLVFTKHINIYDVEMKVLLADSSWETTSQVDSLNLLVDESGFCVDQDLGLLYLSGIEYEDLLLEENLTSIATVLYCVSGSALEALPENGIILIGTEQILYTEKLPDGLSGLERGYNSTTAATHSSGDIIEVKSGGTFTEGRYFIKYKTLPRIDYEMYTHNRRSANESSFLSVHPFKHSKTNKILQIETKERTLSELILSTDENYISDSFFGPLYFGIDVGKLFVTALDYSGNPVSDIPITLEIISGPGYIDEESTSITKVSNSNGQIIGFYICPLDKEHTTQQVLSVTHDGADTLMEVERIVEASSYQEITLFQTLKHDPSFGTVGNKITVFDSGLSTIEALGEGYFDCRCEYEEAYDGGAFIIVYDSIKYTFTINKCFKIQDAGEIPFTRIYINEYSSILEEVIFAESFGWIIEKESIVWDSSLMNGADVIIYEYSTDYEHPVTGVAGAYGPVFPDSISGNTLVYENRLFAIPDKDDISNNLGGYKIISNSEVKFRAKAYDPYTNNLIVSNIIRFKLVLSSIMTGIDYSGTLKIPYGFKCISDSFNIGSGIGGSNFISINPRNRNTGQISLRGVKV